MKKAHRMVVLCKSLEMRVFELSGPRLRAAADRSNKKVYKILFAYCRFRQYQMRS